MNYNSLTPFFVAQLFEEKSGYLASYDTQKSTRKSSRERDGLELSRVIKFKAQSKKHRTQRNVGGEDKTPSGVCVGLPSTTV